MRIAILAHSISFNVLTALLIQDEATLGEEVVRVEDGWRRVPGRGVLSPMAHHAAADKNDFCYLVPPEFDDYGNVVNAIHIAYETLPSFAEQFQHRLSVGIPPHTVSLELDEEFGDEDDNELRLAARQLPKSFERQTPRGAKKRTSHGTRKKK